MRGSLLCAGVGLALLLVALLFDAEALWAAGSVLGVLGAGTWAWITTGARGATVEREVGARTVVEGDPVSVRVTAHAGRLPLPSGWIDEPLLPEPAPVAPGRRRVTVRIEASFARRGRRALPAPALVLRDPLGLAQRTVRGAHDEELLVLPRVHPVRAVATGGEPGSGSSAALSATTAEVEIDGLRPLRPGTPAARIHWPALARGAGLMERKMVAESDTRPVVLLDPRAPSSPDALDAAVRAAASLALHFARRGGCALILPGDRRPLLLDSDAGAWPAAHARLALVDAGTTPALVHARSRQGLLFYVAARALERPPSALGRTAGGCVLVVPGSLLGRRAVLEVASCRGYKVAPAAAGRAA